MRKPPALRSVQSFEEGTRAPPRGREVRFVLTVFVGICGSTSIIGGDRTGFNRVMRTEREPPEAS